jgi:hypothetical protein
MRPDNHHLLKGRNTGDDKGARKLQSNWKAAIDEDNVNSKRSAVDFDLAAKCCKARRA